MASDELQRSIEIALSAPREQDIIEGVKTAVVKEIELIDPSARIKLTDYFNHSFVPDLVLSWRDAGREWERNVYLRSTIESAVAGRDVSALGKQGPMLLALRSGNNAQAVAEVAQQMEGDSEVLVTTAPALDRIADTNAGQAASPLRDLVRANVVKGGRGLIDPLRAEALTSGSVLGLPPGDREGQGSLSEFTSVVRANFTPEAATRLERAGQLIQMGLSGETTNLLDPTATPADDEAHEGVIHGRLSDGELRVLLPYFLRDPSVTSDVRFWRHLGDMLDLEQLESMRLDLVDVDLTKLVRANAPRWVAGRAQVVLRAEADPIEEQIAEAAAPEPEGTPVEVIAAGESPVRTGWRFHGRTLSLSVGAWRIHLSSDGRSLKGRDGSSVARWVDLSATLGDFSVASVQLDGIVRKVRVAAERDAEIYADIEAITQSIQDEFHVPVVELRTGDPEAGAIVEADFARMLTIARPPASVTDLVKIGLRVLAYRNPVSYDEIREYVND
jgi:PHD/YefM family antitoxin component YafN of YafNO toxin-antitoxin module